MKPVAGVADLLEARSQSRSFLFLRVGWAIQARRSEVAFRALLKSWEAAHSDCPALAYVADLSDQAGEVWGAIRTWLELEGQPVDQLTFGGNGALLWLRSGTIALAVPYVAALERAELLTVTRSVFGHDA